MVAAVGVDGLLMGRWTAVPLRDEGVSDKGLTACPEDPCDDGEVRGKRMQRCIKDKQKWPRSSEVCQEVIREVRRQDPRGKVS